MNDQNAPTVSLRRYTRYKENLIWSWVPGLAQAEADHTMARYLRNFFSVWHTRYPVPRRRRMQDSTYFKKVEEREQILTIELMRRLDLWRRQQAQYGNSLTIPHSTTTSMVPPSIAVPPPASLEFDAISHRARDSASPQPRTSVDREVDLFVGDNLPQQSAIAGLFVDDALPQQSGTVDSFPENFLDFNLPPYDASTVDMYQVEPEVTLGAVPGQDTPYESPASSSHSASFNEGRIPEHSQNTTVCETVSTNVAAIETLLQWIEELKRTFWEQHREKGCEVCYGGAY